MIADFAAESIICLIFQITHTNLTIFNSVSQYFISAEVRILLRYIIDCMLFHFIFFNFSEFSFM